jgi:hypothetical protein
MQMVYSSRRLFNDAVQCGDAANATDTLSFFVQEAMVAALFIIKSKLSMQKRNRRTVTKTT